MPEKEDQIFDQVMPSERAIPATLPACSPFLLPHNPPGLLSFGDSWLATARKNRAARESAFASYTGLARRKPASEPQTNCAMPLTSFGDPMSGAAEADRTRHNAAFNAGALCAARKAGALSPHNTNPSESSFAKCFEYDSSFSPQPQIAAARVAPKQTNSPTQSTKPTKPMVPAVDSAEPMVQAVHSAFASPAFASPAFASPAFASPAFASPAFASPAFRDDRQNICDVAESVGSARRIIERGPDVLDSPYSTSFASERDVLELRVAQARDTLASSVLALGKSTAETINNFKYVNNVHNFGNFKDASNFSNFKDVNNVNNANAAFASTFAFSYDSALDTNAQGEEGAGKGAGGIVGSFARGNTPKAANCEANKRDAGNASATNGNNVYDTSATNGNNVYDTSKDEAAMRAWRAAMLETLPVYSSTDSASAAYMHAASKSAPANSVSSAFSSQRFAACESAACESAAFKSAAFKSAAFKSAAYVPAALKSSASMPAAFESTPADSASSAFSSRRFAACESAAYVPAAFKSAAYVPAAFKSAASMRAAFKSAPADSASSAVGSKRFVACESEASAAYMPASSASSAFSSKRLRSNVRTICRSLRRRESALQRELRIATQYRVCMSRLRLDLEDLAKIQKRQARLLRRKAATNSADHTCALGLEGKGQVESQAQSQADSQAAESQAAESQAAESQAADSQAADSQAAESQAADSQAENAGWDLGAEHIGKATAVDDFGWDQDIDYGLECDDPWRCLAAAFGM